MFLAITTLLDPDLPLLAAHPAVAMVLPAHLSRHGWHHETGESNAARVVTSRGALAGSDVEGVVTRIARVKAGDLPHVHPADRDYVAAEMTAFLAAFLSSLRCPLFNRPTAVHLAGLAWSEQHAWRSAAQAGLPACTSEHPECRDVRAVVVLDGQVVSPHELSKQGVEVARRLAALTAVRLVQVELCRRHGGVRRALPSPRLDDDLLALLLDIARGAKRGASS